MRSLLPVAALAIIIPAAALQGMWSGRWSKSEDFNARLAALRGLPLKVGQWTGRDIEPEAKTWERAGVAGGLMRRYDAPDGSTVTIMIVCGLPGPTSVHTPEICYAGAGYDPPPEKAKVTLSRTLGPADEFWTGDFRKQDTLTPEFLRIFHAWSADGRWHASLNPRLDFAGSRALYKLYVLRSLTQISGAPMDDPCVTFMRSLLPEIGNQIRPG